VGEVAAAVVGWTLAHRVPRDNNGWGEAGGHRAVRAQSGARLS